MRGGLSTASEQRARDAQQAFCLLESTRPGFTAEVRHSRENELHYACVFLGNLCLEVRVAPQPFSGSLSGLVQSSSVDPGRLKLILRPNPESVIHT